MPTEIIVALISAGIPALVTIITAMVQLRTSKMHSAKQSILQMILEDKVAWVIDKEFPMNYGRICDEYVVYHENGGNGEVTKKVEEYKKWYAEIEKTLKKK